MILKINRAKTYDRGFLKKVLKSFDFSNLVCQLILECVETPWYSAMMNGTMKGFFKSKGDSSKVIIYLPIFLFQWRKFYPIC